MNAFEQAIWEAERQLGATLSAQDFQEIVMDAKRALVITVPTIVGFTIVDGKISAFSATGDAFHHGQQMLTMREMDLNAAMVFVIRAYRLQKKLS